MKIKEVEKEVGITSKNIRFYEEEGLFQISRNKENQYRDFKEADIIRLKEIKLFRGLGVSLEDIRHYYDDQWTLRNVMEHRLKELDEQQSNVEQMKQLCEQLKGSDSPLIPYVVNLFDGYLKEDHTKKQYAGSSISKWGKNRSRNRSILLCICLFPFVFMFVSGGISLITSIPNMSIQTGLTIHYTPWGLFIGTILTIIAVAYITVISFSEEYYEFCERGFYYIDQEHRKFSIKLLKAIYSGNLQSYAHYVDYQDIRRFKPIIRTLGRVPVNGDNIYETDFVIFTNQDEVININSGVLGVSNEKVLLIAEILKEKSASMYDPYHILKGLTLPEDKYYAFIDRQYRKAKKERLEKKAKKQSISEM